MDNNVLSRRELLRAIGVATATATTALGVGANEVLGQENSENRIERQVLMTRNVLDRDGDRVGIMEYFIDRSGVYEKYSMKYEGYLGNEIINFEAAHPQWPKYIGGEHYETLRAHGNPDSYVVPNGVIAVVYQPLDNVVPEIGDSAEHQLRASSARIGSWCIVNGWPDGKIIRIPEGFNINLYGGSFVNPENPSLILANNYPGARYTSPYPEDVLMAIMSDGSTDTVSDTYIVPNFNPRNYDKNMFPDGVWTPQVYG